MEIQFKKGSRVKASLQDTFAAIEAAKIDGYVSVDKLIADAKPKAAALHADFEWNNGKAATEWRRHQGRRITGSIELVPANSPPIRAYHSVKIVEAGAPGEPPTERRAFRSAEEIMADPASRDELLRQAINDALRFRQRYHGLAEFSKMFAAIDEIAKQAVG